MILTWTRDAAVAAFDPVSNLQCGIAEIVFSQTSERILRAGWLKYTIALEILGQEDLITANQAHDPKCDRTHA
jgi:hypothetical protein